MAQAKDWNRKKNINDVDYYVARRFKEIRILQGLSQEAVAFEVGISTAQVQKYEKAINRISASRLYRFAQILQVDNIDAFFPSLN